MDFSDSRRSSGDAFLPQSRRQSHGTAEELRQAVLRATQRAMATSIIRHNVVSSLNKDLFLDAIASLDFGFGSQSIRIIILLFRPIIYVLF